jgi:Zn-dependent protease with chaperone function
LANQAMAQIDAHYLKPSELSAARQAELRAQLAQMMTRLGPSLKRYPSYAPRYVLNFRRGAGPNAFALPGGTLVMTDELVALAAKNGLGDDALLGVLAHEIGHVEHRHGTRLVVEQGVLNVGLGLALGDVSSMVSMTGTLLTGLAYRRRHEAEADCFALAFMAQAQRPTAPMGELLLALSASARDAKGSTPTRGKEESGLMQEWLSTHPATPARAEQLVSGQARGCKR